MSIAITATKIALGQFKNLASATPGLASIGTTGAVVAGMATSAPYVGTESQIYIPFYGPGGIDAGIVGYTASSLGFLAGLGTIAALSTGVPLAAGVGTLALGIGFVAAAVNPENADSLQWKPSSKHYS